MNITKKQENDVLVITLDGKLDTSTAPTLQACFPDVFDHMGKVQLDLTNLQYVSSAGLRVFLIGAKQAEAKGIPLVLTGVSESVFEVFKMTGFDKILTIVS